MSTKEKTKQSRGKERIPVAKPGHRIPSKKDYNRSELPDPEGELDHYRDP